jgi:hypothetical protein
VKIKIYILTWQDANALNRNLVSLFEGFSLLPPGVDIHVNVINNHTNFSINEFLGPHVNVIHNVAQPDFATAMLARMWNTAIIHGFKDLKNPDADIVVTAQDDTIWNFDSIPQLLKVMENYDFYADDAGDMVCAYKAEAIKKVGLWDERFHYGFGEGDYFLRNIRYNPDRASINDFAHGRVWNPTLHLAKRPEPDGERYTEQSRAHQFRGLSWANFLYKWPSTEMEGRWPENIQEMVLTSPIVPATILYPYFEMDVENLKEKGYIVP